MDVAQKTLLYLLAGIHIVHVGIDDYLKHHAGMVGAAPGRLVELMETGEVEPVDYLADNAHGIVFCYVFPG